MKYILSLILCSCLLNASYVNLDSDLDEQEMLILGKKLYNNTCISCHGKDGETNSQMQLIVKPRKLQSTLLSIEQSFKIIKYGAHYFGAHADIMPAFRYVYDDEQIASLSFYISKTFNPNKDKKIAKLLKTSKVLSKEEDNQALKVGKRLFLKKCALCHGKTGNGKSDYVKQSKKEENFIFPYNLTRTLLSEDQIFLYAKFGGHYWGTDKKDMPSWKNKFDDIKLKSVARYIKQDIVKLK